jgi:hypothetical protein
LIGENPYSGYVKIGLSNKCEERLIELQIANPRKLKLLFECVRK